MHAVRATTAPTTKIAITPSTTNFVVLRARTISTLSFRGFRCCLIFRLRIFNSCHLVCFVMRGAPNAASSYSKNPVHERANEAAFSPTVHERGSPRSFADGECASFVERKIGPIYDGKNARGRSLGGLWSRRR